MPGVGRSKKQGEARATGAGEPAANQPIYFEKTLFNGTLIRKLTEVRMFKLMSVCSVFGLLAMAAALSAQGQPPAPPQYPVELKVGDTAPAFALMGSDGKVHKLSDYKGKTVVLAWFPKAFTGG
jgi:hypothetical protein